MFIRIFFRFFIVKWKLNVKGNQLRSFPLYPSLLIFLKGNQLRRFPLYPSLLAVTCLLSVGSSVSYGEESKLFAEVQKLNEEQQSLFQKVSEQLRCPTCNGLSVKQSDAPFSEQIKKVIVEQVKHGKKEGEIISFFKEHYGVWILREPPKEGFHLIAWIIPALSSLLGLLMLFFLWRKPKTADTQGIRLTSEILDEMDMELQHARQAIV